MKNHNYQITSHWDSKISGLTSSYITYNRNHIIEIPGKTTIESSSDPSFRGDPTKHNPEELFLASISSCHMLWYLHLCASNKISVVEYIDRAIGTMVEESSGSGRFSEVVLNPTVTIVELDKRELAAKLHQEANRFCFIASSCNFEIKHNPIINTICQRT